MQENKSQSIMAASVMAARDAGLTLDQFKQVAVTEYIIATLIENKCNQCRAARALGMHRNTLPRICATLHIDIRAMREPFLKKPSQSTRRENYHGQRQVG